MWYVWWAYFTWKLIIWVKYIEFDSRRKEKHILCFCDCQQAIIVFYFVTPTKIISLFTFDWSVKEILKNWGCYFLPYKHLQFQNRQ